MLAANKFPIYIIGYAYKIKWGLSYEKILQDIS